MMRLLGYMPFSSRRANEKRTLLDWLLRETATFMSATCPVLKKLRTLLGWAIHGPTPKNWWQGTAVSYLLWAACAGVDGFCPDTNTQPEERPSSFGPQLSS